MAKFTSSLGTISGKIGGYVYASNRYGAYIRNLGAMTNPQTAYQVAQRTRTSSNANQWKQLTQIQQWNWQNFADWIGTGGLGPKNLTGFQCYIMCNNWRLEWGHARIDAPPWVYSATLVDWIQYSYGPTWGAGSMSVTFSPLAGVPVGHKMIVQAIPQSPVRLQTGSIKSKWRNIGSFPTGTVGPVDVLAMYTARFGAPVIGNFAAVRLGMYRYTDGPGLAGFSYMQNPFAESPTVSGGVMVQFS